MSNHDSVDICPFCFHGLVDKKCAPCGKDFNRRALDKKPKSRRILHDSLRGVYKTVSKIKTHELTGRKERPFNGGQFGK